MTDFSPPPPPPPSIHVPPSPSPKPSWWKRRWLKLPIWAWLSILAVLIAAGAAGGGNKKSGDTATTEPAASVNESTAAPQTDLANTAAATTVPTTVPATDAPTTTAEPTTTTSSTTTTTLPPAPIVFNGRGDDVVDIGAGNTRFILQATHDGQSNFQVELLDGGLQAIDFPVNEIGGFIGTIAMDISSGGRYLQVKADGNWSLQLLDASTLPVVGDSFTGVGKSVVRYDGTGGIFAITHDGQDNFQVVLHDVTDGAPTDFVVNEIGAYSGRNPLTPGPVLVAIAADGNWTFTKG